MELEQVLENSIRLQSLIDVQVVFKNLLTLFDDGAPHLNQLMSTELARPIVDSRRIVAQASQFKHLDEVGRLGRTRDTTGVETEGTCTHALAVLADD